MLKVTIITWVINAIVENICSRISRRALSISHIRTLVDRKIAWQPSGIVSIVDYHPVENRRVFVVEHRPPRKQAKSRQIIGLRMTYFLRYTNARTSVMKRIVVFLRVSTLCNHVGNSTIAWKDNSGSRCHRVFFHYRFGQKRFIFFAVPCLASCIHVMEL